MDVVMARHISSEEPSPHTNVLARLSRCAALSGVFTRTRV